MKRLLSVLAVLCVAAHASAQDSIYTIDVNGDILTNSQFIDPFFCEDQNTPYEQMYSETLPLPGFGKPCTLRLYNYRGWADTEPGHFRIIDVEIDGVRALRMARSDAWDKFNTESNSTDDYYKLVRLDDATYALIFVSFVYASEPGPLTIVVLRDGKAALVYNKDRYITSLTENPLKIHTISQFPEAVPESTHASLYEVIYQDGNLLKWRMGKN